MKRKQDLIPFDHLNWIETEQEWCLLSEDDVSELIDIAAENGYKDIDSVMKITRWAEEAKCGEILYKLLCRRQVKLKIKEDEIYLRKA
jgi:predicted aldo/keto reductase-like oxidoreductase